MSNSQDLSAELAAARQQLQNAQSRVAELEALLSQNQPNQADSQLNHDAQLAVFVEHAPAAIAMLDKEMKYLLVSRRWLTDYHLDASHVIGRSHYEIFPDIPDHWRAVHQRCLMGAVESSDSDPFPRADGTMDWVRWEIRPWRKDDGEVGGLFIFTEVITEYKKSESSLKRYAQRMEILHMIDRGIINAHSIQEIVNTALTHIRILIPCQQAIVILFDFPSDEIIIFAVDENTASVIVQGNRVPMSPDTFEEFGTDTISRIDDLPHVPESSPLYHRMKMVGMQASLRTSLLFQNDPIGRLILNADRPGFFTLEHQEIAVELSTQLAIAIRQMRLTQDIQRHSAELEQKVIARTADLTDAKAHVEAILNNSPDSILFIQADLSIQQANFSFNHLFHCDIDDYFGKSLVTLIHSEDAPAVTTLVQTAITQQNGDGDVRVGLNNVKNFDDDKRIEVRAVRKDESVFEAELGIRLIEGDGLVCIIRDITVHKAQERQLRYHASLQENVTDAVIVTDTEFRIQSWNKAAERIYGWRAEEVIGTASALILRTEYPSTTDQAQAIQELHTQGWWQGEVIQHHKDGNIRHILGSVTIAKDSDGLPFGVVAVNHDISERKEVSAELERQRLFLKNVIDVSPSMIFVKDYNARFVLANPLVARIYNTRVEDLIGKTDADFNPSVDEVDAFLQADREVIASGKPLYIEEPITNFKGETHWLQTTKVPIVGEDGKSTHVLGISTDITERKQAEIALKESEEKYRALVETMGGGLVIFDRDGKITFINDQFCEILGYSQEETVGTVAADYVDRTYLPILKAQLERRQHLESSSYELLFRHKSGRPVYLLVSGSPLLGKHGEYVGSFAVTTDITAQKQAETALRQALAKEKELGELKSRFVSMSSHEFRTPLATILALTETLIAYRHRIPDDQIDERLDKVQEQVSHLKDIMDDVLMLARMQAHRVEFNPVWLNLDALCRSVIDEFQSRADVQSRLVYTCNQESQEIILDRKLMRHILINLVSNALKYSPESEIVTIMLDYTPSDLILTVRDKGIGIPDADLPYLFEPFHRATNVSTISGTGLGLVITKEAVDLHSGVITVESQLDVGTTFTVRIPIVTEGGNPEAATSPD